MTIFILAISMLVPALLFVFICFAIMDYDKNEDGYNIHNSTLTVQCNAKDKCDFRFSTTCETCKHNCGMQKFKNSYVPK